MAEISKELKIMLIVDIIIAIIYGILYTFLPDVVYATNDAPFYDPHFWRLFGGTVLGIGIMAIYALIKREWSEIRLFFLNTIVFLIIIGIVNLSTLGYITRSATNIGFYWLDTILIIVLVILNGFFFWREEKK